jgi:tetratricopeptide (TPR) repeat protein
MILTSPARMAGAVALAVAVLAAAATSLTGYYHDARLARAETHLARGEALVNSGDLRNGIVELRAALALNRHDPRYALTLARALLQYDLPREAEPYLDEAIASDPTSGPANLARARTARALGTPDVAVFYQRAYFGSWPIAEQATRLAVGFELTEYLLEIGDRERARGMLAQLAVDVSRDADAVLRVAQLLLRAGAPQDAEPLLRDLVVRRPGDEDAWRLLARVTFERHQHAAAIAAADRWLELDPKNEEAATIRRVARDVRALDPTVPRLSARERARRAQILLKQTMAAYDACDPPPAPVPGLPTPPLAPVRAEASRALDARGESAPDDDQVVDIAIRLWDARQERCPGANADLEVLARVFAALAAKDDRS